MSNNYDVMISYSSEDARVTEEIMEAIEARGFRCWQASRDARAGEDYEQEIVSAIENTPALVLVFSRVSNASRHVHREVVLADSEGKTVFPLRIEDLEPTGMMRYQLSNRQRLDYFRDKRRAIETIHARLLAIGCVPRGAPRPKPGPSPYAEPLPPPQLTPPRSVDTVPESSDGLRHFLPPSLDPLYLLFDWRGRIGRRGYFFGSALEFVVLIAVLFIGVKDAASAGMIGYLADAKEAGAERYLILALLLFAILAFGWLFCGFALVSKRLHDLGASAWWSLFPIGAWLLSILISYAARDKFGLTNSGGAYLRLETEISVSLFWLWLLLWPGKAADNKYGFAPNFKRGWKPYDEAATRASARSEFDIPFVVLSASGRIGPKGVGTGILIVLWLCAFAANIVLGIRGSDQPMTGQSGIGVFMTEVLIGVGLLCLGFAVFAFASVAVKRLHDINLSTWMILPGILICGSIVAIVGSIAGDDHPDLLLATSIALFAAIVAAMCFWPGNKDFNSYGPPPGFRATVLRAQRSVKG